MKKWWLAIVAAVVAAVAWLWHKGVIQSMLKMMTGWHEVTVTRTQKAAERELDKTESNMEKVKLLDRKVEAKRTKLRSVYEDRGLSSEEIASRFSRLNLGD